MSRWRIVTPCGYLIGRFFGTRAEAKKYCDDHYSAYRLEYEGRARFPRRAKSRR